MVKVVVNRPPALEVRRCLQGIDRGGLRVKGSEVIAEFFFKVRPIEESEPTVLGSRFKFKLSGCPVASPSGFHVQHGPDNFGDFVFEGFGA